jgi:hypothetical protein
MCPLLSKEQKYQEVKEKFQREPQFISKVMRGNKTCVYGCNWETLWQVISMEESTTEFSKLYGAKYTSDVFSTYSRTRVGV